MKELLLLIAFVLSAGTLIWLWVKEPLGASLRAELLKTRHTAIHLMILSGLSIFELVSLVWSGMLFAALFTLPVAITCLALTYVVVMIVYPKVETSWTLKASLANHASRLNSTSSEK